MNTTAEQMAPFGDPVRPASPPATSAVSWSAILAGAASAAALSLILLMLGAGLGLSSVSPWARGGIKGAAFGVSAILWLSLTQFLASGMGGYLAGRLRTRWLGVHADEVYFRDTVHGFLAWAIASLATAALLGSAVGSIVGGGVQAGASLAGDVATGLASKPVAPGGPENNIAGEHGGPMTYYVDALFRSGGNTPAVTASTDGVPPEAAPAATPPPAAEAGRILVNAMRVGSLSTEDARYLGQIVARSTGLSQQDAEKRVNDTYARAQATLHDAEAAAQEAAEKARKASAYTTLWMFISLLIGAFIASLAAIHGGRRRDL